MNKNIKFRATGLYDCKEKEIYEGDIIQIDWNFGDVTQEIISYDNFYGCYVFANNPICELIDSKVKYKVIGNIYENPQLLNDES